MGDIRDEMAKLAKARNIPLKNDAAQKKKNEFNPKRKDTQHSGGKHNRGDKMPKRVLPLYKDFKNFPEFKPDDISPIKPKDTANTGLLFDKFCDHWSGEKNWKPETMVKQQFLDGIVSQLKNNKETDKLLLQYHARRDALISALKGESKVFKTSWRFVSGLGMGHVLETGFVWHRTLGVPYLPGSSVKGLIRAWADPKTDKKTGEHLGWGDPDMWNNAKRLFGDEKDTGAGSLIVFDALPVEKPKLEVDIMNPHYAPYYKDKTIPPADYHSPVPIFFLTVKEGVQFKFSLAPRPGGNAKDDVELGFELLKCALENIGAGAKTAVGYGYFK